MPIDSFLIPFSYALGYASGTFIGSFISNTLVNDDVFLEVIINEKENYLIDKIRDMGYGISIIDLKKGYNNDSKQLLLIQTKRKNLNKVINYIQRETDHLFMIINEVQKVK